MDFYPLVVICLCLVGFWCASGGLRFGLRFCALRFPQDVVEGDYIQLRFKYFMFLDLDPMVSGSGNIQGTVDPGIFFLRRALLRGSLKIKLAFVVCLFQCLHCTDKTPLGQDSMHVVNKEQ